MFLTVLWILMIIPTNGKGSGSFCPIAYLHSVPYDVFGASHVPPQNPPLFWGHDWTVVRGGKQEDTF